MTTLKRKLLAAALTGAGLMLAGGVAQAAAPDVSNIYGRASPPNPQITASTTAAHSSGAGSAAREYDSAGVSESSATQAYPEHASRTIYPGETLEADTVADGTGRIHEENLDGKPLVDGRGMRQGVDPYAAAPLRSEPRFDVAEILGRSSPPAPENAPDFGHPS